MTKKIKIKEIKSDESMLERKVDSQSFTAEESANSGSLFVPSLQSEGISQNAQTVMEITKERRVEDASQFSKAARYNITNVGNVEENRSRYSIGNQTSSLPEVGEERVFRNRPERINPSLRQDNFGNSAFAGTTVLQNHETVFANPVRNNGDFENRNYEDRINQAFDEKKKSNFRAQ